MRNKDVLNIIKAAENENRDFLFEHEGKQILSLLGLEVDKSYLVSNENEAISTANQIGYPVVLKIVSPDILHKSDFGGVALNLSDEGEIRENFRKILSDVSTKSPRAKIIGLTVSKMAPKSTEIIVGATRDPQFGATIRFGLGGIRVEMMKDVSFRIAPLNNE